MKPGLAADDSSQRLARIALILGCVVLFLLIPFKIGGLGYLPGDDALRHAAYAVDDREWSEVLVLNPALNPAMDSHPGWHAMLRFVHRTCGAGPDGLVFFAFTLAFSGFLLAGLFASRQPLPWLAAMSLMLLTEPGLFSRLLLGRPFFVSMTVLVVLLFFWQRPERRGLPAEVALVFGLLTLSVVMHPTVWYLWSLPVLALVLAGRFRNAGVVLGCLPLAMVAAAVLLGDWYDVFVFPVFAILNSVGSDYLVSTNLVTELQPGTSPGFLLLVMAVILAVRYFSKDGLDWRAELRSVDFLLVLMCWLLGLAVARFWLDWGLPAALVWYCRQMSFLGKVPFRPQLIGGAFAALLLYLGVTADSDGRYTQNLKTLLARPVEQFEGALPDRGGILYSPDMASFYSIYFKLPHDRFRFILGYEPGLMPPEDLRTLRAIQFTNHALEEYQPWFDKLRREDRILIPSAVKPEKPGFEFAKFFNYWIVRRAPEDGTSNGNKETGP